MSSGNLEPPREPAPKSADRPGGDLVRAELSRILAGQEFRTSKRCQAFLRYVVEMSLTGRAECLKERTIGMDVFARSADYEPSEDATVRVIAGDVRKRLDLFYREPGAAGPVAIRLPAGAYIPEFQNRSPDVAP